MTSRIVRTLIAAVTAAPAAAAAAPTSDADRRMILAEVAAAEPEMRRAALAIWDYAERGFQERRSSALLQAQLRAAGFTVKAGIAGMPTAFVASFRTGDGPVIGLLAEFDALPGLAQAALPRRAPIAGRAAGHACGHNLLGAAAVAAAVASRRWMVANHVAGELRVYGAPAEEGGSGKVFLVRDGWMRDVDAMLHWHPGDRNSASQGRTLANISGTFRFTGIASHAAIAPERGRSALDGVEAMNMMVNQMREHVPQETRIHYVITNGGKAANVVPETAEVHYYVRHPDAQLVHKVFDRVHKAAEGAALGTGTTVRFDQVGGVFGLMPNDTLGRVMLANLTRVGGVAYAPADRTFAVAIGGGDAEPAPDTIDPYVVDAQGMASTDVGDVSHVTPTAGVTTASWVAGTAPHSWQATAASGSPIGIKGADVAARTLALSVADLFNAPATLAAAHAELERRRGARFTYRALLGEQPPRLDYRQPAR